MNQLKERETKDGMFVVSVSFRDPEPRSHGDTARKIRSAIEQAAGQLTQGGSITYGDPIERANLWASTKEEADEIESRVRLIPAVVGVEIHKYSIDAEVSGVLSAITGQRVSFSGKKDRIVSMPFIVKRQFEKTTFKLKAGQKLTMVSETDGWTFFNVDDPDRGEREMDLGCCVTSTFLRNTSEVD